MSVLFEQTYGAQALQSAGLRARLQEPSPHWEPVEVAMRGGAQHKVDVYFIAFRDDLMALFAEPGVATDDTPKVADLESRVVELERRVATDTLTGARNRAHVNRIMSMQKDRISASPPK